MHIAVWSIAVIWLCGCASLPVAPSLTSLPKDGNTTTAVSRAQATLSNLFPSHYRATQRAIITVGRRQYVCDGVMTASAGAGYELAVVSTLGVVTGLRVLPDGTCELLKVTPLFKASWSRQYVAADLRRLFVPPRHLLPAGRLDDGRLVLEGIPDSDGVKARYVFSSNGERWEALKLVRKNREVGHVQVRNYRTFSGVTGDVPGEFELETRSHRLDLRITGLSVLNSTTAEVHP